MKHLRKIIHTMGLSKRLLLCFLLLFSVSVVALNFAPHATPLAHAAATTSVQDGNTDSEADCNASGFNGSWILCPIFDMFTNGAQFLLQNILQPFLITTPISTDSSNPGFQIWSTFRIYGDVVLVIGLLVVVFGQSIGGGIVDAYTAKKVLPRIVAAAILINLSIYIVAFLVDFTNILGRGISDLMTAPLAHCTNGQGNNCWDFKLSLGDTARVFSIGLIGWLAGSTAIFGFVGSLFSSFSTVAIAALLVLLPFFFAVLGVFITLIMRQALILLLVMISPIAFALYCLPNTERFFKRWWSLLTEALMVYPIVIAIFGVADVLSVTILQANSISPNSLTGGNVVSNNLERTLALFVAFLLQFIPLLAIPFAFRFASGTLRRVYDAATGAGQQVHKAATSRREQAKRDYKAQSLAARARAYHRWNERSTEHPGPLGLNRRFSRQMARRAGGYNIEGMMSAARAEKAKEINDQIATGRDEEIRGLTVNKAWALSSDRGAMRDIRDASGNVVGRTNGFVRQYTDGRASEFMTLGGAWVNEQDVDAGHRRWGRDQFAQQAALSYEMRKANTEDDVQNIAQNFHNVAQGSDGWNLQDGEAKGMWIGAAFENQNQHIEYKSTDWRGGRNGGMDANNAKKFVDEVYEKKGSYQLSQMHSQTIKQLQTAHDVARQAGDVQTMRKVQSIAETFMSSGLGSGAVYGDDSELKAPATPGGTGRQAMSQGAGHVGERVRELAVHVGVYDELDPATRTTSQTNPRGQNLPPNHPRQN